MRIRTVVVAGRPEWVGRLFRRKAEQAQRRGDRVELSRIGDRLSLTSPAGRRTNYRWVVSPARLTGWHGPLELIVETRPDRQHDTLTREIIRAVEHVNRSARVPVR